MFALKRSMDTGVRILLIAVVLLNALVPTAALAQTANSDLSSAHKVDSSNHSALPEQKPIYYDAPDISYPNQTSPDQETEENVPPKDDVEFSLTADPAVVPESGLVKLNVYIHNNSDEVLTSLIFTDLLEAGLDYAPENTTLVIFDSETRKVSLALEKMEAGEEFLFSYSVRLTPAKQNEIQGKIWLHNAELIANEGNIQLKTSAAFGNELPGATVESELATLPADGGWSELGQVAIYMEDDTVGPNALVIASPTNVSSEGPDMQFELEVFETSALVTDSQEEYIEQPVSITDENTTSFTTPAFLEINLDNYIDLTDVPAGQEPYVATYDEENEIWVKVPIVERNDETNSVTVETTHFSTWGAGLGNSLPQNGANVLLFDQPYTSLFTGAARYSIPVWTPPGRAGLAPDISLSYSSSTVDGVLGDVQAPWVGVGWNIDGVEIVRKITTDENGYGYKDEYALTLNGTLYQLVRDDFHPYRYFTDQSAFLYIERHNYPSGSPSSANTTSEWWEVVTTDGTRYRLGWNNDSEQLALMYGYSCTTGGANCSTPNGAYAFLGYAGRAKNLVASRWRVDKVSDTHGNYMEYHYEEKQPDPSTTIPQFDRESYLQSISYTGFTDPDGSTPHLDPAYQVYFNNLARSSDVPTEFNPWDNIDSRYLSAIWSCYGTCALNGSNAIRTYQFGYSYANVPNSNRTLTLTSLKITGSSLTENGQTIPAATAPTIRLTYQNLPNRDVAGTTNDAFNYPRLVSIDNGSGGLLTFTYGHDDNRGVNSWYNYRVDNIVVESGMGVIKKQDYLYATPTYTGQGANTNLGALTGYKTVTESLLDFSNNDAQILDTKHTFGTVGLDIGRELQTEWLKGSTIYRKSTNVYVTDNSGAPKDSLGNPFPNWNYRYLQESVSYERSGGALTLVSKNTYYRDPFTGNLLVQNTYLGSSLYRKTYYEYKPNLDPEYYILDKASRVLLVDSSNQTYSDTRYHYDNKINQEPTRGDVTLVQKLTGDPEQPDQTADTTTVYDDYGNARSLKSYKEYGTVDIEPTSQLFSESQMSYDDLTQSYPVVVKDALGKSTSTTYLYKLGLPYQTTDPNGWTTKTKYDSLGRTLNITPPGLNQAGTLYIYPSPDATGRIAAPHSVEMQILDSIAGKYRSVWGIYDGAGRMIQTQVSSPSSTNPNRLLVNTTLFNAQGLVMQQSLPYYYEAGTGGTRITTSGDQSTTTEYDQLGRVTSVTSPGNIKTTSLYDGLTTTSADPNGNKVSRTTDGLGRMISVSEFSDNSTVYATTRYFYDAADRLIRTKDAQSNNTTIQYDWLGRKLGMDDPDMGVWAYKYDGLGNMVSQIDARGRQLTFEYDVLNRLTKKITDDPTPLETTYTYGNSEPGTIGLRIGMEDPSGSATWQYPIDYFGRKVIETRKIGGGEPQTLTTVSDWLGRAISTTYDDGEELTYHYDDLGRPSQLQSEQNNQTSTLIDLAYTELGQIDKQTLGNGAQVDNTYDSDSNRLTNRKAIINTVTQFDLSYTYDSNGNITRLIDSKLNETQFYQYDFLNRLTSAIGAQGTSMAATEPATPQTYGQKFEYDKVGNILQINNWGTSPSLPTSTRTTVGTSTNVPVPTITPSPSVTNATSATSTNTSIPTSTSTPSPTGTGAASSTATQASQPSGGAAYLSLSGGDTLGSISVDDLDIVYFDGANWSMFFDASDVGITEGGGDQDLNDFQIVDADTILLTFSYPFTIGSISVNPGDILQFDATSLGDTTAGTFGLYFDGDDVGLDDATNEVIDALDLLSDGRILISTMGSFSVPGLTGNDEDLLAFTPSTLGETTSGAWGMYFDGSLAALGLGNSAEDVDALELAANGDIYLSTGDVFAVTNISGEDEDIFICTPAYTGNAVTSCTYSSTLYFDGSAFGLSANDLDAINLPLDMASSPRPVLAHTLPRYGGGQGGGHFASFQHAPAPQIASVTFTPVADAYVSSDFSITNYGTSTTLRADGSPDINSYLRFNVQGLTGSVTRATLRIYANSASTIGYEVFSVSDDTWTESGITYSNAPAMQAFTPATTSNAITASTWTTVDVTSYITGDGVYNLAFSTTSGTNISFASREAGANAPQLIIETQSGDTATPTFTPTSTATGTATFSNNTNTPTSTPTVSATSFATATAQLIPTNTGIPTKTPTRTPSPTITPLPFWSSFNWMFNSTTEGWGSPSGGISNFGWQSNGSIGGDVTGSDPYIYSGDHIGLNITTLSYIKIRLKNSSTSTSARFYFVTDADSSFNESKAKSFTIAANSEYAEYIVNMSTVPGWTGTLRRLRFDPGSAAGSFNIDYIKIGSDQPYTATPTNLPIVQSLMAHWNFENLTGTTAPDIASHDTTNNNATLLNGVVTQAPGAKGDAISFDGTDDYATVADHGEIKNNGSFTISAWVNPAAVITGRTQYILRKATSSTDFDYAFITSSDNATATPTAAPSENVYADGQLVFTVSDLTPNRVIGPVLPLNTWTLVTGVYDTTADELRLYINGTLAAVEEVTGTVSMNTGQLTFGGPYPNQFKGKLDEIQFYNRWLNDVEIHDLFETSGIPTSTPIPTSGYVTPFPTATQLPQDVQKWGTGSDGNLSFSVAFNPNNNTNGYNGRTCADAVAYSVVSLGGTAAGLSSAPEAGCLKLGDEVLLINLQGTGASKENMGAYEFLRVRSVSGSTVIFESIKSHWYGDGWHRDDNIGTGDDQQRVMLMRVPNYHNVTINGTLIGNPFDGYLYGVLAFRVDGTLTGGASATILADMIGSNGAPSDRSKTAEGYSPGGNAIYNNLASDEANGGGAGYATAGRDGGTNDYSGKGGSTYGNPQLSQLFMGSGGGASNLDWYNGCPGSGSPCWNSHPSPKGGHGGGIIFIAGRSINFPGKISANGEDKPTNGQSSLAGGAGAGGSIRIEGNTVTLGTLSSVGGSSTATYGSGGQGRIAVYYQTAPAITASSPTAYQVNIAITPNPTQMSVVTPGTYGTGADGNLAVGGGGSYNLNSSHRATRVCPDAVSYSIMELSASWAKLDQSTLKPYESPLEECLLTGDEVMIIYLLGSGPNAGKFESLVVGGVVGDMVYFKTPKVNFYGAKSNDDSDIGTGDGEQRVMLMRVPNYHDVTINGTLTANAFDGYRYGVVAFRVNGTLAGSGTILADKIGSNGAPSDRSKTAEGYGSGGTAQYNDLTSQEASGGGGGYATAGTVGGTHSYSGQAGSTYGSPQLSLLFMGSGGGASNLDWYDACPGPDDVCWNSYPSPRGGDAGGIVFIAGQIINFSGTVSAEGEDKPTNESSLAGGAGSGGSIRIDGDTITLGTLSVMGGSSSAQYGRGGQGRVAIYYSDSLANSATLCAQAFTYCKNANQVSTPTATVPAPTPTKTATPTSVPQGWYSSRYAYSPSIPHAVTSVSRGSFTDPFAYDENGNMTCRTESGVTYIQTYNAENRIASIQKLASGTCAAPGSLVAKWDFTYDGDGIRTGQSYTPYPDGQPGSPEITRYYFGGAYETKGSAVKKYYSFAGQIVAMKDDTGLKYFLTDHLGSVIAVTSDTGTLISQQRYLPFGQVRTDIGSISQTDFGYTSQRKLDEGMGGIMDYKARFYSPYINRFLQPDTMIPSAANPQSWNRYSYVTNRPLIYSDPTGHKCNPDDGCITPHGNPTGGSGGSGVDDDDDDPKSLEDMKTSKHGKDFIKWWENGKEPPRAYPYLDMGKNCTIGYGHLLQRETCSGWPNKTYRNPKLYPTGLTVKGAEDLFNRDIVKFEDLINRTIKVDLTQTQFDALVSYTFNTGDQTNNPYFKKGIPELINSGHFEEAAAAMASGPKTSGDPPQESAKLVERRQAEATLFLSGTYGNYAPWKP